MREYLIEDCQLLNSRIFICHSKLFDRAEKEDWFRAGQARIVVVTSAFGMGIDIADIHLVIVSQLLFSIPAFYQIDGRAERDSKKATALLRYNSNHYQYYRCRRRTCCASRG